jgi:hypothetical protein
LILAGETGTIGLKTGKNRHSLQNCNVNTIELLTFFNAFFRIIVYHNKVKRLGAPLTPPFDALIGKNIES